MRRQRKGLSAVYGFIVIFTLLMAGMGLTMTALNSQASIWNAQSRATQVERARQLERLSLSLNGTSLAVANVGLTPSKLLYLHQVGAGDSIDRRLGETLQGGGSLTLPVSPGMQRFALVTSLGNVFWTSNSTTLFLNAQGQTLAVTFDASGLSPSWGASEVATVDGGSVTYSQLPKTYQWAAQSTHTFSFVQAFSSGSGTRIGWSSTRGLSTSSAGTITATQPGNILASYNLQYHLDVTGGSGLRYNGSPADDGWYDAGSSAQVSSSYVSGTISNQARQSLSSYSLDGSTPQGVPRSGVGAYTTTSITMNSPHSLSFLSQTQYFLAASGGDGVTESGSQTGDGWFDSGSTGTATSNYVWSVTAGQSRLNLLSWNLDNGASQAVSRANTGTYTTTPVTMNTFHTVNFNSVRQYYVSLASTVPSSGSVPALSTSYSYTSVITQSWTQGSSCNAGALVGAYYCTSPEPQGSQAATSVSWTDTVTVSGTPGDSLLIYTLNFNGPCSSPYVTVTSSGTYSGSYSCNMGSGAAIYWGWILSYGCENVNYDPPKRVPCGTGFTLSAATGTFTYSGSTSGSTSTTIDSYSASGNTVTYTYGLGYTFPGGSTATSWSTTWPSGESYSSSSCAGASVSGNTMAGSSSCTGSLVTTRSGTYTPSIGASVTGDNWYDAGSSASISASQTGPFSFSSWSTSDSASLQVASPSSSSTTVTVNTIGTITENVAVGP